MAVTIHSPAGNNSNHSTGNNSISKELYQTPPPHFAPPPPQISPPVVHLRPDDLALGLTYCCNLEFGARISPVPLTPQPHPHTYAGSDSSFFMGGVCTRLLSCLFGFSVGEQRHWYTVFYV